MITRALLEGLLNVDEPDYAAIARLGPEALPVLRQIVAEADVGLSAKALHAASLNIDQGLGDIVDIAAGRQEAVIRVIAATAIARLSGRQGVDIAMKLLADRDVTVRERAADSVNREQYAEIAGRLRELKNRLSARSLADVESKLERRFPPR